MHVADHGNHYKPINNMCKTQIGHWPFLTQDKQTQKQTQLLEC